MALVQTTIMTMMNTLDAEGNQSQIPIEIELHSTTTP